MGNEVGTLDSYRSKNARTNTLRRNRPREQDQRTSTHRQNRQKSIRLHFITPGQAKIPRHTFTRIIYTPQVDILRPIGLRIEDFCKNFLLGYLQAEMLDLPCNASVNCGRMYCVEFPVKFVGNVWKFCRHGIKLGKYHLGVESALLCHCGKMLFFQHSHTAFAADTHSKTPGHRFVNHSAEQIIRRSK